MNCEHPDLLLTKNKTEENVHDTVEDIIEKINCRVFIIYFYYGSLRGVKKFMHSVNVGQGDAQCNTMYRLRHWIGLRNCKPIQRDTISTLFHLDLDAIEEEQKFLALLKTPQ